MKYTEERITKHILKWLSNDGWVILAYDFPQSGTGVVFHPNSSERDETKNKGSFIPDIIALKEEIVLFFENKDRFYFDDFVKIQNLRENNTYTEDIKRFLSKYKYNSIFYGIGIPEEIKTVKKSLEEADRIDFLISSDLSSIKFYKKYL